MYTSQELQKKFSDFICSKDEFQHMCFIMKCHPEFAEEIEHGRMTYDQALKRCKMEWKLDLDEDVLALVNAKKHEQELAAKRLDFMVKDWKEMRDDHAQAAQEAAQETALEDSSEEEDEA